MLIAAVIRQTHGESPGHHNMAPHGDIHTPKDNVDSIIDLTCRFLNCGRKLETSKRSHAEHSENTQSPLRKATGPDSNLQPFRCEMERQTTAPPFRYVATNPVFKNG